MLRDDAFAPHVLGLLPFFSVLDVLLGTPLLMIAQVYLISAVVRAWPLKATGFLVPIFLLVILFGVGFLVGGVIRHNELFLEDARFLVYYPILLPAFHLVAKRRTALIILRRYWFYVAASSLVVLNLVFLVLFEANNLLFATALSAISSDLPGLVALGDGFVLPGVLVFCLLAYMIFSFEDESLATRIKILGILAISLYVSSISLLVVSGLYFISLFWKRHAGPRTAIALFLLIPVLLIVGLLMLQVFSIDPGREEASLSNRFRQAEYLFKEAMLSPVFGNGFGHFSMDYVVSPTKPYLYELDALSLLMKTGVVGSLLYFTANYLFMRFSGPAHNVPSHFRILLVFFVAMTNGGFYTSFLFVYLVGAFTLNENQKGSISAQSE